MRYGRNRTFFLKREYSHNEKVQHSGKDSATGERLKKVIVYVRIKMSGQDDTVSSQRYLRRVIWRNARANTARCRYIKKGVRQKGSRVRGHRCYRGLEIKVSLRLEARSRYSPSERFAGVVEALTADVNEIYCATLSACVVTHSREIDGSV